MKSKFHKILIANRGEIAVRIISTAKKLGIKTVAIFSKEDTDSLHAQLADEAYLLAGDELAETYLNQNNIIRIAKETKVDAIHPGYGFLSENAVFAEKVESNGILFVGATPEQIRLMGEKNKANKYVASIEVPILPSVRGKGNELIDKASNLDFPLLVKASAGGGGKGMLVVNQKNELAPALKKASRQALQYFGNDELFVEQFLEKARHIEVQIMGDGKGNVVHLFERDCSVQRRYQKVIEEAPACCLNSTTKSTLYKSAIKIAKSVNYRGAGTIEFLVDEQQNCWFLEMNTRLQVEHPVTEMITGLDLVEWQLNIAAGNGLPADQNEIQQNGYAIEARICAEDPANNFLPDSGRISTLHHPSTIRWDSFIEEDFVFPSKYDSLIGKLIVHGENRDHAIQQLSDNLDDLIVGGIKTNQFLLKKIVQQKLFKNIEVHTKYLDEELSELLAQLELDKEKKDIVIPAISYLLYHFYRDTEYNYMGTWRINASFQLEINKKLIKLFFQKQSEQFFVTYNDENAVVTEVAFDQQNLTFFYNGKKKKAFVFDESESTSVQLDGIRFHVRSNHLMKQVKLNKTEQFEETRFKSTIVSELYGKIVEVFVHPGDEVLKGEEVLVMESMKTEFTIQSPVSAKVKSVKVQKGNSVKDSEVLIEFDQIEN